VDKFPSSNTQRGGDIHLPQGAKFFEGDLENLPFPEGEKFDFLYASHVFEHVNDPKKAVREVNRVTSRGYIETPSPLREQLACPLPFDRKNDFHTLFCWNGPNTLHVIHKSEKTIGEFPDTSAGRFARALFHIHRDEKKNLELLLPGRIKASRLFFKNGLKLHEHESFAAAAAAGHCAFEPTIKQLLKHLAFPLCLRSPRLTKLRKLLQERSLL